jgi:phosphatidylglycerophosphatase A
VALAWGISFLPQVWLQAVMIIVLNVIGVPLCTAAARRFGGVKDPSAVVWDEIATVPIAFFLVPAAVVRQPIVLIAGFVLHRLFDITNRRRPGSLSGCPMGSGLWPTIGRPGRWPVWRCTRCT